jgi:small subunit ribosomal protein S16
MVVIRLTRTGRTHDPHFTIVAIDSRKPREGLFLEKLGQYNPKAPAGQNLQQIKTDAIKAWVNKGALLSDTVRTLFKSHKVQL